MRPFKTLMPGSHAPHHKQLKIGTRRHKLDERRDPGVHAPRLGARLRQFPQLRLCLHYGVQGQAGRARARARPCLNAVCPRPHGRRTFAQSFVNCSAVFFSATRNSAVARDTL